MKQINYRLGFCCKWLPSSEDLNNLDIKQKELLYRSMNQPQTTLTALRKLEGGAKDRIEQLIDTNCKVLWKQLHWLSTQPENLRMFRITSTMVPADGVPDFAAVTEGANVRSILSNGLKGIREFADAHGIRLCMHPGQYSNLCSDREDVVERAIEDIERHNKLAEYMGYGDTWHSSGFVINIHANYRQDPHLLNISHIIANKLSPSARNLLTIENDEVGCGLDELLTSEVIKQVPVVLDIHHHWIRSKGEYIQANDPRIELIKQSWRDIRPLGHVSTSDELEILVDHSPLVKPDFIRLAESGISAMKLRKHSFMPWNKQTNIWTFSHLAWADLEVEAKAKNLAARELEKEIQEMGGILCCI